jgi:hypothetical protein
MLLGPSAVALMIVAGSDWWIHGYEGRVGGAITQLGDALLQNMFIISIVNVSFVSTRQTDTIYTMRKRCLFNIGCLKTVDTNKCTA